MPPQQRFGASHTPRSPSADIYDFSHVATPWFALDLMRLAEAMPCDSIGATGKDPLEEPNSTRHTQRRVLVELEHENATACRYSTNDGGSRYDFEYCGGFSGWAETGLRPPRDDQPEPSALDKAHVRREELKLSAYDEYLGFEGELQRVRRLERDIDTLLESSITMSLRGRFVEGLNKAMEADKNNRILQNVLDSQQHDEHSQDDPSWRELYGQLQQQAAERTFAVLLNLGNQHQGSCVADPTAHVLVVYASPICGEGKLERVACTALMPSQQLIMHGRCINVRLVRELQTAHTEIAGCRLCSVRVNIGNIYVSQQKFDAAVKMYNMALDSVPREEVLRLLMRLLLQTTSRILRCRIINNVAYALFLKKKYAESTAAYEQSFQERALLEWRIPSGIGWTAPFVDTESFNLMVCYYATGKTEKMQEHLIHLLSNEPQSTEGETKHENASPVHEYLKRDVSSGVAADPQPAQVCKAALKERNQLTEQFQARSSQSQRRLLLAGALVARALGGVKGTVDSIYTGFGWVIDTFRFNGWQALACEMEMQQAAALLDTGAIDEAIRVYKSFDRTDSAQHVVLPRAATNLSFIYILEKDICQATHYADLALASDRFNSSALVNKGCCAMLKSSREQAKHAFLDALNFDADCVEALYNLGLLFKAEGKPKEALTAFEKLLLRIPGHAETLYHIGDISGTLGHTDRSKECFSLLTSPALRPGDAELLSRLGTATAAEPRAKAEDLALHYFLSSFNKYPCNFGAVTWLAVYYAKRHMYQRAARFLEHAVALRPRDLKWIMMLASCHRHSGNFRSAIALYTNVLNHDPNNMDCLRHLIKLCKKEQLPVRHYVTQLRKLQEDSEEERITSNVEVYGHLVSQSGIPGSLPQQQPKLEAA